MTSCFGKEKANFEVLCTVYVRICTEEVSTTWRIMVVLCSPSIHQLSPPVGLKALYGGLTLQWLAYSWTWALQIMTAQKRNEHSIGPANFSTSDPFPQILNECRLYWTLTLTPPVSWQEAAKFISGGLFMAKNNAKPKEGARRGFMTKNKLNCARGQSEGSRRYNLTWACALTIF